MTGAQVIVLATPFFLGLIAAEFAVGLARGRNTYRLNDALNSIGLGVMSQVTGILVTFFSVGLYALVHDGLALASWSVASVWTWLAALLAYANAVATGRGDHVDFSLYEAAVEVFDPGYGIAGSARASAGLDSDSRDRPNQSHLYPIMPCKDGYVRFTLLAPRQWRGMWGWMGAPEDLSDPRYDATLVRFQEWVRLGPRVAAFLGVLAFMAAGVFVPKVGYLFTAAVAAFLAWLIYLTWPRLAGPEKLMRVAILALVVAVAFMQAFPR